MEILNASDAKLEFSEVLIKVQCSSVRINKNGKFVAVGGRDVSYRILTARSTSGYQTPGQVPISLAKIALQT